MVVRRILSFIISPIHRTAISLSRHSSCSSNWHPGHLPVTLRWCWASCRRLRLPQGWVQDLRRFQQRRHNNLGKHLNKETGQGRPEQPVHPGHPDRLGSLAGTSTNPEKEQMARQANNIRTFYFDKRKKMEDIIPQVLLVNPTTSPKETAPRQLFVD